MKNVKSYILLHIILIFYTLGDICSKTAASKEFLSFEFCLYYGFVLLILAVYAVLWQQIIKKIPLNVAYANKAITLIWGMIWGSIIFKEHISISNIIGSAVVLTGVILMVNGGEKNE